jgi:hypothetical protein
MEMKFRWIVVAVAAVIAAIGGIAADPALARAKHKVVRHCVDRPYQFSWSFLLPGSPTPQPNGFAPAVYQYGRYIGQDPDRNIRLQLKRDPATGYAPL